MRNQPAHHLLAILVLVLSTALPITAAADAPLELLLVRHAEKVKDISHENEELFDDDLYLDDEEYS